MRKKFEYGQKYPDIVYKHLVSKWFNNNTSTLNDADLQKFVNDAMTGRLTFQCADDIELDDPDIDVIDHLLMDIASEKNDELINTYTDEIDWDNDYLENCTMSKDLSLEQLERRITALENKIKEESLKSRVAKLERMLLEEDESEKPKSSEDYLMMLLNMLFKSRKVNPNGNSLEGNYEFRLSVRYPDVGVLNMAIGDWEFNSVTDKGYNIVTDNVNPEDLGYKDVIPVPGKPGEYEHPSEAKGSSYYTVNDSYTLTNEVEIKKIIGAFCKINKCIVEFNKYNSGYGTDKPVLQFVLKKSPTFQAPRYQRRWGDSDSDWETLADQERRHNSLYHGWR